MIRRVVCNAACLRTIHGSRRLLPRADTVVPALRRAVSRTNGAEERASRVARAMAFLDPEAANVAYGLLVLYALAQPAL